jgi:hypothetical protein
MSMVTSLILQFVGLVFWRCSWVEDICASVHMSDGAYVFMSIYIYIVIKNSFYQINTKKFHLVYHPWKRGFYTEGSVDMFAHLI